MPRGGGGPDRRDIRLNGTTGVIEIGVSAVPPCRIRRAAAPPGSRSTPEGTLHGPGFYERAMRYRRCLLSGRDPERAPAARSRTEIIFAIYESSRRHGRVDLH